MKISKIITNESRSESRSQEEKSYFRLLHWRRDSLEGDYLCRTCLITCSSWKTCLITHSICLTTHRAHANCLFILVYFNQTTRSARLSTCSTRLSTRSICPSTRSTRSTICCSFYNWSFFSLNIKNNTIQKVKFSIK